MKIKVFGLLFSSLLAFTLVGCGSNDKETSEPVKENKQTEQTSDKEKTTEVTPTGNVVDVTITAKNFEFDLKEIKANVGDTVKLTVVNANGGHAVGIDAFDVNVLGGNTVEFVVTEKGTFQYYCAVMCGVGHDKMVGNLIVS
jgi:cytochrome c oxidase subunit 2